MVMTIAVRIMPCANGSAVVVWPSLIRPRTGGLPDGPPTIRISRLTALPISNSPNNIRVRLRSSSRYTPTLVRPPIKTSGTRKAVIVAHRRRSLLGHLDVHSRAEAAQHVEHQADDDQIHAEVEEQRGDELDRAEHRNVELHHRRRQHRRAEQQRRHRGARRQRQARAEDLARVQRQRLAEFVAAAGEVAQHQRQAGGQSAREAAAGCVVAGEEEVRRQHHDEREDHPGRDLEHQRSVPRVAQLAAAQPGDVARGRARRR